MLKLLVALPSVFFIVTGLRWLVDPAGVAPMFGLALGQGVGLSSQVGDLSAFFLTLGSCMLIALVSGRRIWYFPAIMLLSITAAGRIVAWLVHDAALAVDMIGVELVVSAILLVASRRLAVKV
jgi:hypothetical protein